MKVISVTHAKIADYAHTVYPEMWCLLYVNNTCVLRDIHRIQNISCISKGFQNSQKHKYMY